MSTFPSNVAQPSQGATPEDGQTAGPNAGGLSLLGSSLGRASSLPYLISTTPLVTVGLVPKTRDRALPDFEDQRLPILD